jgi:insulysin
MIDFYNKYIDPSSPSRSKVSVHMHAAAKPDSAEMKPVLAKAISEQISKFGITLDVQALTASLADVDISKSDDLLSAVVSHIQKTQKVAEDTLSIVKEQGEKLMKGLPQFGGSTNGAEDLGDFGEDIAEDIASFKAGLEISRGARPVRPLEMFEETTVKL